MEERFEDGEKGFFMPTVEDSRAYDVVVVLVTGWFPEGSKREAGSKDQQEGVSRRLSKYNLQALILMRRLRMRKAARHP